MEQGHTQLYMSGLAMTIQVLDGHRVRAVIPSTSPRYSTYILDIALAAGVPTPRYRIDPDSPGRGWISVNSITGQVRITPDNNASDGTNWVEAYNTQPNVSRGLLAAPSLLISLTREKAMTYLSASPMG